ncbi:dehydrogenase/reductase SDR family member 11 isoform X2 [Parasteatoda tepidariorum]|uniref:dehydrogenase/reductase SDR family member 11 isoform X2 n=1 Tax=Parasteatoda tepidariorum TaxID=114398 RepID=UPI001C7296AA|nr:dehydrogenase/reductase SDR family member 11 isoform X1 [Parasteatoda tepidariorum]
MERWNGRVALVTGASVGIGAAICRQLVKHGMVVVGCARNVKKINEISEEDGVKKSPGRLIPMKCDLSNESEILAMFQAIKQDVGRLDVCINNAGLSHNAPLLSGTTSDWKNMLDVNILALCICTREAVKLMNEKGIDDGHIIHISSMGGHRVAPGMSGNNFYCGTKFMVRAITEGLRREVKEMKSKIRVSSVSPGVVETEFFPRLQKSDPAQGCALYNSMECLQPDDIAGTVVYILGTPPYVEVHDVLVRPQQQAT